MSGRFFQQNKNKALQLFIVVSFLLMQGVLARHYSSHIIEKTIPIAAQHSSSHPDKTTHNHVCAICFVSGLLLNTMYVAVIFFGEIKKVWSQFAPSFPRFVVPPVSQAFDAQAPPIMS